MSKSSYVGGNVNPANHTMAQWLNKTNVISHDMGTVVVTTTPNPSPNTSNGGVTSGNAHIEGIFSANTLVAKDVLRGGTTNAAANLDIQSNVIFSRATTINIQANTSNFTINAGNTSVSGNFAMSNTTKSFSVVANTVSLTGTTTMASNTTFSGANVSIAASNLNITSNTTISGSALRVNANTNIVNANTTINSTKITLGTTNTQTVDIKGNANFSGTSTIVDTSTIQLGIANTQTLTVDATATFDAPVTINNPVSVNDSFSMNNNTKAFSVVANTVSILGTTSLTSNTTFSGANVSIASSNLNITSNTTVASAAMRINANTNIVNANTTINSTKITLGTANTQLVDVKGNAIFNGTSVIVNTNIIELGTTNTHSLSVDATSTFNAPVTVQNIVTVNDAFLMNNNTKSFSVVANAVSVIGTTSFSSNTTFSGANVSVAASNLNVTSNTTVNATNFTINANTSIVNANTTINSTKINLGTANTQIIDVNGKIGKTILPANTSVGIGTTTNKFGDLYNSNTFSESAHLNGNLVLNGTGRRSLYAITPTIAAVGAMEISLRDNANVEVNAYYFDSTEFTSKTANMVDIGSSLSRFKTIWATNSSISTMAATNLNVTTLANVQSLKITSSVTNGVAFANSTDFVSTSGNFTYNGTVLTINTAPTTTGLSVIGRTTVGDKLTVGAGVEVTGNSIFGVFTSGNATTGSINVSSLQIRSSNTNHILYTLDSFGNITGNSNFSFNGTTLTVNAGNASSNSLNVIGKASIGGATTIGNTLTVSGATSVNGNFSVTSGTGSFSSNVDITGSTVITGDLTVLGTTFLSSNSQLALNTSTVGVMTINTELVLQAAARTTGNIIPKTTNINDLGSAVLKYRTVYANNVIADVAWSNVKSLPSPVLTFTGEVTGSGTMTSLGNISVALAGRNANSTVSGFINTAAQTFNGIKTFSSAIVGSVNGNANTATRLATSRNINETGFDGGNNITIPSRIRRANEISTTTVPIMTLHDSTYDLTTDMSIRDIAISNRLNYHISSGTLTSVYFNASSDSRLKTNVKTIENSLEKVNSLRGVEYDRIDVSGHHIGVIAQEVEKVFPEVIHTDDKGYKYVAYANLVGVLIESIKELNIKIEKLENKLKDGE